jgi:esterase
MILAHETENPTGRWPVVFVHGILGSRTNWKGFARRLVERLPQVQAILLDLPAHGDSHPAHGPHTVEAAAAAVRQTLSALGVEAAVLVGHSWGGKVVLALALSGEMPGVRAAVIVDAPPGERRFGEQREQLELVLDAVAAVPMPVARREDMVAVLRARGLSERLALWMTTNLKPDGQGGLVWKFDLAAIPPMLQSFGALDLWDAVTAHGRTGAPPALHLVRGGESDRFSAEDTSRLVRATALGHLVEHVIPGAGHWVHTDEPALLLDVVAAVVVAACDDVSAGAAP